MELTWSDAEGCYLGHGEEQADNESVYIRFYKLATSPFYGMLMVPTNPTEEDAKDCPAALFLVKVENNEIAFLLPLGMDEKEHEAMAAKYGVEMKEEKLVGSPEAVLAYLDGLANTQGLELLQRYAYPAPPKPVTPPDQNPDQGTDQNQEQSKPKRAS